MCNSEKNKEILKLSPVLRRLLLNRGIDENNISEFLSSKPQLAYDPFLLANMRAGVDLLLNAIDRGKKITVYGDYDADGVTSTALLVKVLNSLGADVSYYIPSRIKEGYGLNKQSIEKLYNTGTEVIVTVDCGISSRAEVEYAEKLGMEVLVTDHHSISSKLPNSLIIDPKLKTDKYPFKGLAGVGVAYKLSLALNKIRKVPSRIMLEALELTAIGTVADIMPLIGENRTIVKCGLRLIHLGCRNKGLSALIRRAGFDYKKMKSSGISFGIAPRINAAGRVGDALVAVRLFLSEDGCEIEKCCNELIRANEYRRKLQNEAFNRCIEKAVIEKQKGDFLIIEDNIHEGVLGIVAGKLREHFNRPVAVITECSEGLKGSARSIPSVDLFSLLCRNEELFINFGGHKAACGFTLEKEKLKKLKKVLNKDMKELYEKDSSIFKKKYEYEMELLPTQVDMNLAEEIELLEPCGMENENPVFCFRNITPENWYMKNDGSYAKFTISTENDKKVGCILFHDVFAFYDIYIAEHKVDIIGSIEINCWRNKKSVQINVESIAPCGII